MQVPTSLLLSCKWRLLLSRGGKISSLREQAARLGRKQGPFAGLLRAWRGGGEGSQEGGKGMRGCS